MGNFERKPGYGDRQAPRLNPEQEARQKYQEFGFKAKWITEGIDKSFVEFAEKVGYYLATAKIPYSDKKTGETKYTDSSLSSSKIRSIYSEIKRVQTDFEKEKSSFYLLKPKVAYAVGRDKNNLGLQMFKLVFDECFNNVETAQHYYNLCNIMEAIIAYHKANNGRD
jgi:CRISPR-associated protein Csm2